LVHKLNIFPYIRIMEKIDDQIKDFITPTGGQSQDPEYLAWKEKKIQEAIDWANANPDKMIPLSDVMKEFGLER